MRIDFNSISKHCILDSYSNSVRIEELVIMKI